MDRTPTTGTTVRGHDGNGSTVRGTRRIRLTRLTCRARLACRLLCAVAAIAAMGSSAETAGFSQRFTASTPAEVTATVTVRCDRCAWDVEGREAVVLAVTLDGRYVQHLPVVRTGRAQYHVMIGAVTPGPHSLEVDADETLDRARLARRRRHRRSASGQADAGHVSRASRRVARAVRVCAPGYGRPLYRRARVHVVRGGTDRASASDIATP